MGAWLCTAVAAPPVYAHDIPPSSDVASSGKLTIANTLDYAPFSYVDGNGEPAGIIVELAAAMAQKLDADLNIQRTPFASLMPGLASGRFKIAWESFAVTEERLEQVHFVMFLQSGLAISTRPDLLDHFSGPQPLCGKRVGVAAGSASDFLVDRLTAECSFAGLEGIEKSLFNSAQDIVQAVLSGRIDARVDDATASSYYETVSGGQLVVAPVLYDVAPLGIAIARDDPETAEMVISALSALFADGTYLAALERHGMGQHAISQPYLVDSLDDLRELP